MATRVFCIGNGESRAPIDLIRLRPHGKIDKKSIKLSDGTLGHVYNVKNKWFDRTGLPIDKPENLVTRDGN